MTEQRWPLNLAEKEWRYDWARCGYFSGQADPVAPDHHFIADSTLFALKHADFGRELIEAVTGKALPSTERVAAARPLGIGQREEEGCRDA